MIIGRNYGVGKKGSGGGGVFGQGCRFHFIDKRSFHFKNDEEKRKTKRSFIKMNVFEKVRRFVNNRRPFLF